MSMMQMLLGAAGSVPVYVENVFNVDLVNGTGAVQTVTNGIDLAAHGGMVWSKARGQATAHGVHDTERGVNKKLSANTDAVEVDISATTSGHTLSSFNSNGFTLGADQTYGITNYAWTDPKHVHWTFRKCPGFFDVVTYDATGTDAGVAGRQVPHNLGCKPGMIWVKKLNAAGNWLVYNKGTYSSDPEDYNVKLDYNGAKQDKLSVWNDTAPTKDYFVLGDDGDVNSSASGSKYVAYLFADGDDPDAQVFGAGGDESIIKMGTYDGTSSTGFVDLDLGWEPQWLLIKKTNGIASWAVYDTDRGMYNSAQSDGNYFYLILSDGNNAEEGKGYIGPVPQSDGVHIYWGLNNHNAGTTDEYMYAAIRKPMN